jgi:hypothetical protein
MIANEILVELLGIDVNAPTFAIDDHFDEVGFGRGDVFPGGLQIEDGSEEGRVFMGIEQIQRAIAQQVLIVVNEIKGEIERTLVTFADSEIGRGAAEMNAHSGVGLPIHDDLGRNLDICIGKVGQFLFPIRVFELEENRPNDGGVVEVFAGKRFDAGGFNFRAWRGWGLILPAISHAGARAWAAPSARSAFGALLLDIFARQFSFLCVEPVISIAIEFVQHLEFRLHRTRSAGSARSAESARSARPRARTIEGRWPIEPGRKITGWREIRILRSGTAPKDERDEDIPDEVQGHCPFFSHEATVAGRSLRQD